MAPKKSCRRNKIGNSYKEKRVRRTRINKEREREREMKLLKNINISILLYTILLVYYKIMENKFMYYHYDD